MRRRGWWRGRSTWLDLRRRLLLCRSCKLSEVRVTDVGDDGEIADGLDDDEPPVDRVGFDWQDSLLEVDDLVFWGVKPNDSCDEHHGVGKGQSWSKEGCGCENVDDRHVALPGVVQFFVEHVAFHLVLFFIEGIDWFKETIVELGHLLLLSALEVVVDLEHEEGNESADNCCGHVDHDDGQ